MAKDSEENIGWKSIVNVPHVIWCYPRELPRQNGVKYAYVVYSQQNNSTHWKINGSQVQRIDEIILRSFECAGKLCEYYVSV